MNEADALKEILKRVRQIDIKIRRRAGGLLAGSYRSAFKGEGMVFSDFREYAPGDDIRSVSWNLTAKMGRLYVKILEAERESPLFLAVDVSRSMNFGGGEMSKRELVNQMAGLLAFCAQKSRDPLSLLLFAEKPELFIPPKRDRRQALSVLRALCRQTVMAETKSGSGSGTAAEESASFSSAGKRATEQRERAATGREGAFSRFFGGRKREPLPQESGAGGTNFPAAFSFIRKTLKKRSRIFLFSDFCSKEFSASACAAASDASDAEGFKEGKQLLSEPASRHDLVCVSVSDPLERRFPPLGLIDTEDLETGRIITIDASAPAFRKRAAVEERIRRERLKKLFAVSGCESVFAETGGDPFRSLIAFLQTRQKRERL